MIRVHHRAARKPRRVRSIRSLPLVFLCLAITSPLAGQEAYGRVWLNRGGKVSTAVGARLEIRCPSGAANAQWASGEVSSNGTYRMGVPAQGRCDLRVVFKDRASAIVAVFFTRGSTRANLELVPADRGWGLRRR